VCGLSGFFTPGGMAADAAAVDATRMNGTLRHRGPDDEGVWVDAEAGIALAHRRLSILDLSSAGHQPMVSVSGRYVLVYNGEIYNHEELRARVEATSPTRWRGHSDTETLLGAIEVWGLSRTLRQCVGMFALALWDRKERALLLARDRMGEKPLFWGWQGRTLLFGSETKALRAHPDFRTEIARDVLPLYLRYGYVPAPWSIWKGLRKLVPGTIVQFEATMAGEYPEPEPFWSLEEALSAGLEDPFRGSDEEAVSCMETQLRLSVGRQMVADVPLGAFLSGGVDSSTVVALMQAQSSRPVKTFTIGFDEQGYDEAVHARAVAEHLGTEHTELYVRSPEAAAVIPKLPEIYDEPFGDASAIPTHLVSALAREHVTVSLSGDGGDEVFGGYSRYFNGKAERVWRTTRSLPLPLRVLTASALRGGWVHVADSLIHGTRKGLGRPRDRALAPKAEMIAAISASRTREEFYRVMTSQWQHPPGTLGENEPESGPSTGLLRRVTRPVERMMVTDTVTYLPDDILVKVDRAAMAVSLETRVPLLDHQVVELAWRMPFEAKIRDGEGKWLLRQVLYRHVPKEMVDRPKRGFAIPVDAWLRGPLREWAEELLSERRLEEQGLLDARPVRARWRQHVEARHNWRDSLWLVLMFQAWMERMTATAGGGA
jgi:asparagine synthase (glutamine-hydrolysing)